ncbi:hypothetical protein RND71_026670 [Anisodus tanguticus]|uniref:Uncharacterized protein n=1 Tax=Anisodus tanguticus TaxID=243964 RepID=A0AAE1V8I5_9SOLA|nr:hypothetical protein RND71_026670 [Anisodus tanguticus]
MVASKGSVGAELVDGLFMEEDDYKLTVFDAVSLDYKHVSVITDATVAATPDTYCEKWDKKYSKVAMICWNLEQLLLS